MSGQEENENDEMSYLEIALKIGGIILFVKNSNVRL